MYKLVILSLAVTTVLGQGVDPRSAKILKEQRFNAGDGRAGSAYATENGHVFREETDKTGNRIGQYSYVGSDGKTYNVKYSAGIDGFRILEGDHIRATGADAAPYNPELSNPEPANNPPPQRRPAPPPPPPPQQQPQRRPPQAFIPQQQQQQQRPPPPSFQQQQQPQRPSFAPRQPQQPSFNPPPRSNPPSFAPLRPQQPSFSSSNQQPSRPQVNPFINPHDPTHKNFRLNQNAGSFSQRGNGLGGSRSSGVPNCADCAGVNPFRNPFDSSHSGQPPSPSRSTGGELAGHLAGLGSGLGNPTTTPHPKIFFPPGELKLNRFDTGFNFNFES